MMDKSVLTNAVALLLSIIGYWLPDPLGTLILSAGLFALSGAITNWLAVHMLFERVPGFYGSGVIPARFEDFKAGIHGLIMEQFFSSENLAIFFRRLGDQSADNNSPIAGLMDKVDLNRAFDDLIQVILGSGFGSMLTMLGGASALEPLRQPFIERMRQFLLDTASSKELADTLNQNSGLDLRARVEAVVAHRLAELTPTLVKEIIQAMIRQHLGWLVVWGGVVGGLIGLLVALVGL
jgi:uncharacterized membrane protein YheB (UPF0754 family)